MRLRVLSDLHLEYFDQGREIPEAEVDAVVLAGDIHRAAEGMAWARKNFADTPILYVPGNHEFYDSCMPLRREELAREAALHGITLLDNSATTLGGVRFLGTTLWTDFNLYRDDPAHDAASTEARALRYMPDFRIVESSPGVTFTPQVSCQVHQQALDWLTQMLEQPFAGPTVVITHHAPLAECIPEQYQGDPLSPAFASHLPQLMGQMSLWIHGHVHEPVDMERSGTRILANPGGYPEEFEPALFEPCLVVEV
ncbi:metallophosphoesterase family protein [Halomonas sp. Bachu 37]|uniref:metallophosphoesterase family protein n=1 Tax=Halomonas kashgarensis TaxID=3084920 RepID=UPI0032169FC0